MDNIDLSGASAFSRPTAPKHVPWKASLAHHGVLFPPAYEAHGVPLIYDGQPFELTREEEEIATLFAMVLRHGAYASNATFRSNFFADFKAALDKRGEHPIVSMDKCDFDLIWDWYDKLLERKRSRTVNEKRNDDENTPDMTPYKTALVDGAPRLVIGWRIEPPGLFRGRGAHPLQGRLKRRLQPEDVTINVGENDAVPAAPPGHSWKEVVHQKDVRWTAMWTSPLTGVPGYAMLGTDTLGAKLATIAARRTGHRGGFSV